MGGPRTSLFPLSMSAFKKINGYTLLFFFFFCEYDLSEKPEAVWLFPPGQTLAKQKANIAIVWEQLHVFKEAAQRTCVTHCSTFTSRRGREGLREGGCGKENK